MLYAIAAVLLWGSSYAASGFILRSTIEPLVFYFFYSLAGIVTATLVYFFRAKNISLLLQIRNLEFTHAGWFLFALVTSSLGAWMTYEAMGAKNATLASLVEISYPLFVVLFTWLFFRDFQLHWMTFLGGAFVIVGVFLIIKYAS